MSLRDHSAIAHKYATDVTTGSIKAARWVVLACQRHLDDLKRVPDPDYPYRYDGHLGAKICRFAEHYEVYEGEFAGRKMHLDPWQCFILTTIFGWVHKAGRKAGKRRFRNAYLEIPRGNGKSALLSTVALYMLAADGEGGSRVVCAGTSAKVARYVFERAHEMSKRNPALTKALGIELGAHAIMQRKTGSKFVPLSKNSSTSEGENIHCGIIDELHLHPDRRLYDSLQTGMGKRPQSLLFCITTAGVDVTGVCYQTRNYITKVLGGEVTDETWFGVIYGVPEGIAWDTDEALEIANPAWHSFIDQDKLRAHRATGRASPADEVAYRTKHLNEWMEAAGGLFDVEAWKACANDKLRLEDFKGRECHIGVDLADRIDLTSIALVFPERRKDGAVHYTTFIHSYAPEDTIKTTKHAAYYEWVRKGYLQKTDGNETDFTVIENAIRQHCGTFDVRSVAYDPWKATQMAQRLSLEGLPVIEFRNNVANISEPTKELQAAIRSGRISHDANPLNAWAIGNAVGNFDTSGNVKIKKLLNENKIDPVLALAFAIGRAVLTPPKKKVSVYETRRGVTVI